MIDRITKARMGLIFDAPFFGSLVMRLPMVRDDAQPTFCTDGRQIRYNQAFLDGLSNDELKGVLAHEVAHVALGHLWRMGQRDPQKWNAATDYAINDLLTSYCAEVKTAGKITPWALPKDVLLDPQFSGMSSEEIYRLLPDGGEDGDGAGAGPGQFEAPKEDGPDGAEAKDAQALEEEWTIAVTQAAQAAKMQGNCPGSVARLVEELVTPKVPWREVLREFVRRTAKDDFSWRKPNRRYGATTAGGGARVMLPSLYSERLGRIAVAVDTSGSIDQETLADFQGEVQAALDECRPEGIEVIVCDARVHRVQNFEPGDAVRIDAVGGGGTDFRPVFEHLQDAGEDPECLIFFTDLAGTFPAVEPEYPVLWAAYRAGGATAPFGEVTTVV